MIQQETQWTEGLPRVSSLQQRLSTAAAMARQRLRRRGQLRRAREGDRAEILREFFPENQGSAEDDSLR